MSHSGHSGHEGHDMPTQPPSGTGGHHSMGGTWNWGYDSVIVFDFWQTSAAAGMAVSCAAIFVLSVLFECFRNYRNSEDRRILNSMESGNHERSRYKQSTRAILHAIEVFWGFFLMMAFMTLNGFVCLSLVAGAGVGFYMYQKGPLPMSKAACH
ncbi:Ctr copper transporter family-domain-containing protein [Gaertneriomyces semiglobifer]|nr:Ctr copper transporter family-domain-containing protein [Gaertneriomyces semiglobifer]